MTARQALHRIVDELPDTELPTARRVLEALSATTRPSLDDVLRAAPYDDEPDHDDVDGGLSEAREQARRGDFLSTEEVLRALGDP